MFTVSLPPHIHSPHSVSRCMWSVVIALVPALACAFWFFGLGAAIVTAVSVVACVVFEYAITRWMLGRRPTVYDGSAALTGLLLALNLPSNLPVWIVVVGAFVAIAIGKMAFGGLGCNIFNPALVGRVFLLLSFPAQMTSWPLPAADRLAYTDAATGATTLSLIKTGAASPADIDLWQLTVGGVGGSLGEVSAIALLIGFIYLLATRVISWHIPVSIIATVALMSFLVGADPLVEILSGGLLLGSIFMATDYVTSPMTRSGMLLYGVMIGLITLVIRLWGAYPEGMSFAILIMNGFTPLINRYFKPARFGSARRAAKA
ncbi:MAG: RnfABCDGE type electron transport complex subunit D [Muribaculaceae bacterium]|nr:RnfABCDGE type electron transport complex subunit D [Muribaculaceae bacterium]